MENTQSLAVARVQTPEGASATTATPTSTASRHAARPSPSSSSTSPARPAAASCPPGTPSTSSTAFASPASTTACPSCACSADDVGLSGLRDTERDRGERRGLRTRSSGSDCAAGQLMNLGDVTDDDGAQDEPARPGPARRCDRDADVHPQRVHEAIGVFGAVSVATACLVPGSVANEVAGVAPDGAHRHARHRTPHGLLQRLDGRVDRATVRCACGPSALLRTARLLMRGEVFVPRSDLDRLDDHRLPRPLHDRTRGPQSLAQGPGRARTTRASRPRRTRVISDDEIVETIESNQLRLLRERGADMTIFSPRASAMEHHVGDEAVSAAWSRACNDLIARVVDLFPDTFVGVVPTAPVPRRRRSTHSLAELERCVLELGFVGLNLNPDPSGGRWNGPPLTDRSWYPIYEKMVELDVPGDDPRLGQLQPQLPRHRGALHERRHDRLHAAAPGRPLRRLPDAATSSSPTAAARSPTTGDATADSPTC